MSDQAARPGSRSASGTETAVDLPEDLRREIREFARELPSMDYYAILAVERDADSNQVRRAFFERSKRYHPDRYFKRALGPYETLLHEIYKRVVAANDVLRDENMRRAYDRTLPSVEPPTPRPGSSGKLRARPRRLTRARSLLRRPETREGVSRGPSSASPLRTGAEQRARQSVLGGLEKQLRSGRRKAKQHYTECREQQQAGDWARAASQIRLAIAYDPREAEYHDALADVLPKANELQAADARRRAELLSLKGDRVGAIEAMSEAARLQPTDAALAMRVAVLIIESGGDIETALDFGRQAVELEEMNTQYRKQLGLFCKQAGRADEARSQLQRAWELDPMDKEVKAALLDL